MSIIFLRNVYRQCPVRCDDKPSFWPHIHLGTQCVHIYTIWACQNGKTHLGLCLFHQRLYRLLYNVITIRFGPITHPRLGQFLPQYHHHHHTHISDLILYLSTVGYTLCSYMFDRGGIFKRQLVTVRYFQTTACDHTVFSDGSL